MRLGRGEEVRIGWVGGMGCMKVWWGEGIGGDEEGVEKVNGKGKEIGTGWRVGGR